jgi:acetyltransferase-like isoleucine patch superfamily enzyme
MIFFLNPKRKKQKKFLNSIFFYLKYPFLKFGTFLGFQNIEFSAISGETSRLVIGNGCSTMNTIFNTTSGVIKIGNDTIFGHNCMVLTGRHRFYKGKRAKLVPNSEHFPETPKEGFDIIIGDGCFIASGVTILAPVKIGNNVLIAAGSIVNKNIPDNTFCAGNPARVIKFHEID